MSFSYKTKHTWADKIVLFGLFIAGLLIAYFIAGGRSATEFSKPIELEGIGVAVSIPAGNGWESDEQWKYTENSFTVSSFFSMGSANPIAAVHCRYLLASADEDAETQIQRKMHTFGGSLTEKGNITAGSIIIDWFHMTVPATGARETFEMLFGTAHLPDGRMLNIEVRWSEKQEEMAKEVFEHVATGFEFRGSPLRDYGVKIIEQMKASGVSKLLKEQSERNYFVIKDTKGEPLGFTIDILADLGEQARMNIQAASSFYIRGRRGYEEVTLFQGNNNLSEFVCKSETVARRGRSGSEEVLDSTGILAVKKYGTSVFGKNFEEQGIQPAEEQFFRPGPASIPDVLGDLVYGQVLASKYDKIAIDVIKADGAIIPAIISRMGNGQTTPDSNAPYVFRVDFLNNRNSFTQVYVDEKLRVYKEAVPQQYTLEQSSPEELKRLFPEKSDDILQPEE